MGVIRPTSEIIGNYSESGSIGILATQGTVNSESYTIEISKFAPHMTVVQEACPMWVPLIENNEHNSSGADFFIQKNIDQLLAKNNKIDTILLACTHYPLIKDKLIKYLPSGIKILSQGEIVAESLAKYLKNHPEIDENCSKTAKRSFFTTDSADDFNNHATIFYNEPVASMHVNLV